MGSYQSVNKIHNSTQDVLPVTGKQILLVDDCIDVRRLFLSIFQNAGAEVTLECNGLSAVELVKNSRTDFDAIVMDFQMPEMDGISSTRNLRDFGYRGAIIAVTAYGSEELKKLWFQAGCDDYFEKPVDKHELLDSTPHHSTLGFPQCTTFLRQKQKR